MSGPKGELLNGDRGPPGPYVRLGTGFGAQSALYRWPREVLWADAPGEVEPALAALDAAVAAGRDVAGYFAYELGYLFEPRLAPLLPRNRPCPLLLLGVFDGAEPAPAIATSYVPPPPGATPSMDEAAYQAGVERALELIQAGDVYQINLTYGLDFNAGDPHALFAALLANQSVPYPAIVDLGGPLILSLSPELFFRIENGRVTARPMKGTAKRARTLAADDAAARALALDPKNRAENLMITDLLRNDLAKIARVGSVRVPELFTVETYRTLHTLTSTIEAELDPGTMPSAILRALFPCGSITGAPKVRAMEIIRELEPEARGVYTGAIGVFRGDGSACFNVAIRTLMIQGMLGRLGIGGGIVADSEPEAEAAETRLKARFLTGLPSHPADQAPFGLIETLRFEPDQGFLRLNRHLARLAMSERYFGMRSDYGTIVDELMARGQAYRETMRVRLVVFETEQFEITAAPLAVPRWMWRARFSSHTIESGDPYRAHKTTRRGLYDEEHSNAAADDMDEVLFLNERGEVTEGSRTNVFLERGGILLTPPVASGALPGVLRAELLDQGRAQEIVLKPADLADGKLFLGNSLRGLIPTALVAQPLSETSSRSG